MADEYRPEFIRRKFTITESLDEVLKQMADRYYQGNVSLCLRASIESYREILEGEGYMATRRIERQLENLVDEQRTLLMEITSVRSGLQESHRESADGQQLTEPSMTNEMVRIIELLKTTGDGLEFGDLVEQLDLGMHKVQPALGRLVDRGVVTRTGEDGERFTLAGFSQHYLRSGP
ncbi:hypothetical protein GJR96_02800 [Haloferax sp. MBLA0076]|uniref:Uncharacterized protein n=1 Tax=Haloferax litoreum TaxID=2666140 RepID=A0A6A8GCJ0_9EURY|nr:MULTISPECIES: hypothetical protein [Haloferax]KAB1192426.1 hypothetical protein Hfx1148_02785 [Haloferax sp. CBA1148]MRX20893.1 hypothetical protein [Haloferax litoreum]